MVERRRITWFVLIRLVVVSIIFASTTFLYLKDNESVTPVSYNGIVTLTVLTVSLSLILLVIVRASTLRGTLLTYLTYIQLIWDLHYVTVLIILTGGIVSPYSFLYLIVIIGVSISLSRREAFLCASLCSIIYGALLDLQFYGQLVPLGLDNELALQFGPVHVFYTIFVNILAFFLTAFLSGYLAERAQASERALHKKEIDYDELQRLYSAIVANIDSGLVTLNNMGRVRVFNRYAEDYTGVKQEEAYDALLADVSPCFAGISADEVILTREEIVNEGPDGNKFVFGYMAVPLYGHDGLHDGIIINFKDLAPIKRLESRLKRADRLAAIGELAARMAHEIRNPLAAISGSVQLIAQGERVSTADHKLLDIVLRETQRLNGLITDFLGYARPSSPVINPVSIESFLAELLLLVRQDERFREVGVLTACPPKLYGYFDAGLMRQVFWNLLLNAAESIVHQGKIQIEVVGGNGQGEGKPEAGIRFTVSDNGQGMSMESLSRVFEPFYSTKSGGTGLGLATVYRIIEAHSGSIDVQSSIGKGTLFAIWLPDHLKGGEMT